MKVNPQEQKREIWPGEAVIIHIQRGAIVTRLIFTQILTKKTSRSSPVRGEI